MQYVYVLKLNNNTLYTGCTGDLQRRFTEHQSGKVDSTRYKLPVLLLLYEAYRLKSDAERRERFLKTTEGKRFLKQQIRDVLIQENML